MRTARVTLSLLAAGILLLPLTACSSDTSSSSESTGELAGATISVGSKEFTESIILGMITSLALENAGAEIIDKTGVSGTSTVRAALESGEMDLYWDYTGTGWVNILGHTPDNIPDDLYAAVSTEDLEENGIVWLEPAPFENAYAIAAKTEFMEENGVYTLSDAAEYIRANPAEGSICAASEFLNRDDGLPGLEAAYEIEFPDVLEMDFNLVYTQVGESCTFTETTTTDGRNVSSGLSVLEDDRGFFVEYRGAVTLRQDVLDEHPAIKDILDEISARLTNDVMMSLNSRVDVDGETPADVAEDWLTTEGLIG
ncbi:glycine betaine ABC transporter substrate-binding protein [Microbacterium soli]|uniref:Glycine betaine ABC transporter substrate-binding protein n=1 Tax=Microbacterium soli TaxID=446075 RepID=A0ABP7N5J4_9MICO